MTINRNLAIFEPVLEFTPTDEVNKMTLLQKIDYKKKRVLKMCTEYCSEYF